MDSDNDETERLKSSIPFVPPKTHEIPQSPFVYGKEPQPPVQENNEPQQVEQKLYQQMMALLGVAQQQQRQQQQQQQQQLLNRQEESTHHSKPLHFDPDMGSFRNPMAPKVCDFPPLMPNAWVSVSSLELGSEVYYQCNSGYHLDGPRVATCVDTPNRLTQSDERTVHGTPRWSKVPSCIRNENENQRGSAFRSVIGRSGSNRNNLVGETPVTNLEPELSPYLASSMTQPHDHHSDDSLPTNAVNDSERVTQCYDNRAGSVFVASCRGESVICTVCIFLVAIF